MVFRARSAGRLPGSADPPVALRKWASAAKLSRRELTATLEAALSLLIARWQVGRIAPTRWPQHIRFAPEAQRAGRADAEHDIRLIRRAVARAARNLPLELLCLPQALAAQRMLVRRGIVSDLRIGVERPDEASAGDAPRAFHAWLVAHDRFVTGDCDEASYCQLVAPEKP
ncbi:lasso peptide biosynthesis B2 protein [Altererythrobacter aurantiacus]|uniref:Lasso peptide biosynthesis B2 protein n=1 Tax=Parapontixanthobacter aurantiacus TaxID=1463599 RepID=A0A844ZEZ2_9SPHN|nr:lasso peptide biosynthesis B2 protein [Parapontixanthobacter aurantiacus]